MAKRGAPATFQVENFSKGLNTRFANTEIDASESPDLQNIVFDFKGELKKRNGFAKVTAAGIGSGTAALDSVIYGRNDGTELHIAASNTDVYKRTSPSGTAWTSIKTLAANSLGDSTTQFDITNTAGNIYRYTWDGTGTDPKIIDNVIPGTDIIINAQNFIAANNLTSNVINVGTDFFDIDNASGVAETNKTIGTGSITIASAGARWTFLEIDDVLYAGNGVNDWFKFDGTTATDVSTIPHGNIAIYHDQRLWVVESSRPSAITYSLTNAEADDVEDFTTDSATLFIGKDDGQKITALKSLGNSLVVFKERSTYLVTFTQFANNDGIYIQDLTDSFYGCVGKDSCINVENDVFFFTGREIRRIGFDANFQGVRTNPVSLKIDDQLEVLTDQDQTYMAFHDDIFYIAVAKNQSTAERVYILDTRYEGWSRWNSNNANFRINGFLSDRKNNTLYFSSAATDRIYKFNDSFSDDGTAIDGFWKSKRFDIDAPHLYKRFRWLYVTSRNLRIETGNLLCYKINVLDNREIRETREECFQISQVTPEGIWGAAQYNLIEWGGPDDLFTDPDFIYNRISLNQKGISIQFEFSNDIIDEDLSLQSITLVYTGKDLHHYPGSYTR